MTTTTAGSLQADTRSYLAEKTLPVAQRTLVIHNFGQKFRLPRGHGTNMTFTRYNRLALPYAPLSEGVPPISQGLTIQQVTGTAQQWGGQVTITDVAQATLMHDPFEKAKNLSAMQLAETLDRNDFLTLMGSTQVNYVNTRGSRAALIAGDVLDPYTITRTVGALVDIKAPQFNGPPASQSNPRRDIREGQPRSSANPRSQPHYVAVSRIFPLNDLRSNSQVTTAWAFSDINKLYNAEVGEWNGMRFCESNMVPNFVGVAQVNGANAVGTLATASWFIQLTGVDTTNQYESRIYQVSASVSVTTGGISFTTPNIAGFTFNAYVGSTSSPANLGLSTSGPTSGPMTGQAVQLPANTSVTITAVGLPQVPPAAPATGVTVYPIFVFGEDSFGVIELEGEGVDWSYLDKPEKADPQNQLRIVAWKTWTGAMILNSQFLARIECASAFGPAFG
jgi:N4-gp56 family major capsid protein